MRRYMRKINRAVTDKNDLIEIINRCSVCRIGLYDGEYPYIVPMNFGYSYADDLILYFHCATEGRKLDIIQKDNRVCFEMDCSHELKPGQAPCDYSMNYESIIGEGEISIVTDPDKKIAGLNAIMKKYGRTHDLTYRSEILEKTTVLKLVASDVVGKRLNK